MPDSQVAFLSGSLSLQGVLHIPVGDGPVPGVVVCHPHPRMGGSMQNNVVIACCYGLVSQGIAALRFNFRGIGESQGVSEAGDAEISDAIAALDFLRSVELINKASLGVAGYSFGASLALEVATRVESLGAIGIIACPAPQLNEMSSRNLDLPKLFISGDIDQAVPADQFKAVTERFSEPKEIHSLRGADHFLWGHEGEISELLGSFFKRWLL